MVTLDGKSFVKTVIEGEAHGITVKPAAPPLCTICLRVSLISITSKV